MSALVKLYWCQFPYRNTEKPYYKNAYLRNLSWKLQWDKPLLTPVQSKEFIRGNYHGIAKGVLWNPVYARLLLHSIQSESHFFAFSAFSEVPEFCLLEFEDLSLELSSQLWDSKRPGKSKNADQISAFRCNLSTSEICAWRAERKMCPHLLSDTALSPESFISLSPCCCWQNYRRWWVAPVSAGLSSRCFVELRLWNTLGAFNHFSQDTSWNN